jgi:hypothetical protein
MAFGLTPIPYAIRGEIGVSSDLTPIPPRVDVRDPAVHEQEDHARRPRRAETRVEVLVRFWCTPF